MNSSTEKPNAVLTGLRSKWSIGGLCVLVLLAMWLLLSGKDTVPEEPLLRISTIKADEVVLHPRARVSGSLVAKDSVEVGTALSRAAHRKRVGRAG